MKYKLIMVAPNDFQFAAFLKFCCEHLLDFQVEHYPNGNKGLLALTTSESTANYQQLENYVKNA